MIEHCADLLFGKPGTVRWTSPSEGTSGFMCPRRAGGVRRGDNLDVQIVGLEPRLVQTLIRERHMASLLQVLNDGPRRLSAGSHGKDFSQMESRQIQVALEGRLFETRQEWRNSALW